MAGLLALVGVGLVVLGRGGAEDQAVRTLLHPPSSAPDRAVVGTSAQPPELRAPWRPGSPRLLRIPALRIQAPVIPVRTSGRTLVPPRDPATLGWWADGARPGSRHGTVLVTGHTVHGAGDGALEHLDALRPGDPVTLVTDRSSVRYVVRRVNVLSKAELARRAPRLFLQGGSPRLALVTCTDWDGHEFRGNVVVTARPARAAAPVE